MRIPTVVFDYDRTLAPGDSFVDVVTAAIDDDPRRAALGEAFRSLRERWARGDERLADLPIVLRLFGAIRRRHVDAHVASRREPPEEFARLFAELRRRGVRLHILSSSYRDWLVPIGRAWGFADGEIHARRHLSWFGGRAYPLNASHLLEPASKAARIRALVRAGRAGFPMIVVGDGREDVDAFRAVGADHMVVADFHRPATDRERDERIGDDVVRAASPAQLCETVLALATEPGRATDGRRLSSTGGAFDR